jgi:hypothetical protein
MISDRLAKPLSVVAESICSRSTSGIDRLMTVNYSHRY